MNPISSSHTYQDHRLGGYLYYLALLCLLLGTSSAAADWHGQLSLLSDYLYRGYSKNRGNPVVQARIDYEGNAGWFTGMGLSQVSFDDRSNPDHADFEANPYLGWSLPISDDWKTELSTTGYIYNDKVFNHDASYAEYYAALHYQDWLSGKVSVAPNAYQRHVTTLDYELSFRRDISDAVQFSAGLGYYQAKKLLDLDHDYFYWNAGASWFVTSYLAVDVRYVDVNLNKQQHSPDAEHDEFYPRLLESKYLLSITVGF